MSEKRIGVILNGVTGRMGMNQHLVRSIHEIRKQGGVALADGTRLMPDPLLVGRNAGKLQELAKTHDVKRKISSPVCRATLRAMASPFRNTSGPMVCVPTLMTTPPSIWVMVWAMVRKSVYDVPPSAAPSALGCSWMMS